MNFIPEQLKTVYFVILFGTEIEIVLLFLFVCPGGGDFHPVLVPPVRPSEPRLHTLPCGRQVRIHAAGVSEREAPRLGPDGGGSGSHAETPRPSVTARLSRERERRRPDDDKIRLCLVTGNGSSLFLFTLIYECRFLSRVSKLRKLVSTFALSEPRVCKTDKIRTA